MGVSDMPGRRAPILLRATSALLNALSNPSNALFFSICRSDVLAGFWLDDRQDSPTCEAAVPAAALTPPV